MTAFTDINSTYLASRNQNLPEETFTFLLQRQNVGANFFESPQRLRFVKVAGEADFVADLHAVRNIPGIRRVRQDFSAQKSLDAAFFQKRYLLGVAEIRIGFVLDDRWFAVDGDGK